MSKTVSRTDIGLKRKLNQDYVFTADLVVGHLPNLYLVADGMGGHKAGGFASKYAVESIVEVISSTKEKDAFTALNQAIIEANARATPIIQFIFGFSLKNTADITVERISATPVLTGYSKTALSVVAASVIK